MMLIPRSLPVVLFAACTLLSPAASGQRRGHRTTADIPPRVFEVYRYALEHHAPPAGHIGGRVWHNREKKLPRGGKYHEFDVNPKVRGRNRGAERVIIDYNTGRGWYTSDHYRTFISIPRGP
jgi:guanyl-specific ribonuclease Sa